MNTNRQLCHAFMKSHPVDAAITLERFPPEETAALLQQLPSQIAAAQILEHMDPISAAACLGLWAPENISEILTALPLYTSVRLLRNMEDKIRNNVLTQASVEISGSISILLQYPENTAGSLMDPNILMLPEDLSVGEAWKRVQRFPQYVFYYIYVVTRSRRLAGVFDLRELMLASRHAPLTSIMTKTVARISARTGREALLSSPDWYRFYALPVVDEDNILLGAIRFETIQHLKRQGDPGQSKDLLAAFMNLGELYWQSIFGLMKGCASITNSITPQLYKKGKR